MKFPTITENVKHKLALVGIGAAVLIAGLYLMGRNSDAAGFDLGVDPSTFGSQGLAGGGLRSLLNKLGLGDTGGSGAAAIPSGNNNLPGNGAAIPDFTIPESTLPETNLGDLGSSGGGGLAIQTQSEGPQSGGSNFLSNFLGSILSTPEPNQPPAPIYNGSSYANEPPTYENGLIIPAGALIQSPGGNITLTQPEYLTPIPGGFGNLAQDSYGNIYQTSLPPTQGPGTHAPDNYDTPIGGTWNPGWGHDPNNPYDTN